jgi:rhodanese-related sulfurtransferase
MEVAYLNADALENTINGNSELVVIDTRSVELFRQSFIPGSLAMPLSTLKNGYTLQLIKTDSPLVFVCNDAEADAVVASFLSMSYTNIKGVLHNGFEGWANSRLNYDMIIEVDADEVAMDLPHDGNMLLVDCRMESEFDEQHISGAYSLPPSALGDIALVSALPEKANLYLYCNDSVQSTLAASVLKRHGIHNLRVVSSPINLLFQTKGIPLEKQSNNQSEEDK